MELLTLLLLVIKLEVAYTVSHWNLFQNAFVQNVNKEMQLLLKGQRLNTSKTMTESHGPTNKHRLAESVLQLETNTYQQ